MALSNWDTLAVVFLCRERIDYDLPEVKRLEAEIDALLDRAHEEGTVDALMEDPEYLMLCDRLEEAARVRELKVFPGDGRFYHEPSDWEVSIYKNWLYVNSPSRWREGAGYLEPTIGEIWQGYQCLGPVHVSAVRGPQRGVYACVWVSESGKDDQGRYTDIVGMAGCGVYGWGDDDTFVGVTAQSLEWFKRQLASSFASSGDCVVPEAPAVFAQIDLDAAERFNQGDAYLAAHFGIDVPTSPVGQSEQPLFDAFVRGMRRRYGYDDQQD